MRKVLIACLASIVTAACGGNSKSKTADAPVGSDGSGGGSDAPSGNPTTISVTLNGVPTTPSNNFIAMFQDGTGPWQAAPAPSAGVYTFTVDSSSWGFGYACSVTVAVAGGGGSATEAEVALAGYTVAERTSLSEGVAGICRDPSATLPITVTGNTITNIPATSTGTYDVYFGGTTKFPVTVTGTVGTFTLTNIAPAKRQLFIVHSPAAGSAGDTVADYVYRSPTAVDETGSGSAVTIDWGLTNNGSGVAATQIATAANANATFVDNILYTASGTDPTLSHSTTVAAYLATAAMGSNDIYEQLSNYNPPTNSIFAESWVSSVVAPAVPEPVTLNGIIPTETATTPYPILTTTWDAYANTVGYIWFAQEALAGSGGTGGSLVTWTSTLSPGYVGATPSYAMPDLTALGSAWMPSMAFTGGNANKVNVSVNPSTSSGGIDDLPFVNPAPTGTMRARTGAGATVTLQ